MKDRPPPPASPQTEHLELLLLVLRQLPKYQRATMLQSYIAECGPIPDARRAEVVGLL